MHRNQHHKQNNAHDVTHEIPPHEKSPTEHPLNTTNIHLTQQQLTDELIIDNEHTDFHDRFHVISYNNTPPPATITNSNLTDIPNKI